MKFRLKILKRMIAVICAGVIATSCVTVGSVGAVSTKEAEAGFSLKYLDSLPKRGEANFDRFQECIKRENLLDEREYKVKHKGGRIEPVTIKEKEVYDAIKIQVNELREEVNKKIQTKNDDELSEKVLLAEAIYCWVAKHIEYDHESLQKDKDISLRKPQDALFVFDQQTGVCVGKANLVNLMMRIAEIPSAVVVSATHAFNAVYLEEKGHPDRSGWTLIDSTWAAPKSDMNQQLGKSTNEIVNKEADEKKEADEINKLIQGTVAMSAYFMKDNFDMNDNYTRMIDKIIYIPLKKRPQMKDVDIEKFNNELEEKLKKLNDTISDENQFKINKFRVFKNKEGQFLVEYETNLTQNKAADLYKKREKRNEEIKAKELLASELTLLFDKTGFGPLNEELFRRLNSINKLKDSSKLNLSRKYSREFKTFLKSLVKQYQSELESNINKINDKKDIKVSKNRINDIVGNINGQIETKLEKLNKEYQDIAKFKRVRVDAQYSLMNGTNDDSSAFVVFTELLLPVEDAVNVFRKQANNEEGSFPEFFPGFYDKSLTLRDANEEVLDWNAHKIEKIVFGSWHDSNEKEKNLVVNMKTNNVIYRILGTEEGKRRGFELIGGDEKKPLENVEISPDMIIAGIKFKIGSGIKSITLKGNEIIDLSEAKQLESIDITDSKAYVLENGVLYEKNSDSSIGKKLTVPSGVLIVNKKAQRQ